jgi:hypothetical protein
VASREYDPCAMQDDGGIRNTGAHIMALSGEADLGKWAADVSRRINAVPLVEGEMWAVFPRQVEKDLAHCEMFGELPGPVDSQQLLVSARSRNNSCCAFHSRASQISNGLAAGLLKDDQPHFCVPEAIAREIIDK